MRKLLPILLLILLFTGCSSSAPVTGEIIPSENNSYEEENMSSELSMMDFSGSEYITVNSNVPVFTDEEKTTVAQTIYSNLDELGRCGPVFAVLDKAHMAEGEREPIGMYKPSGWPEKIGNAKYDFIDGKYLFNRSHLLGWQFWGDDTNNEKNLITGTRQMNAGHAGMLNYESAVASYLRYHPENHVAYRVTPHFRNDELIARGVQMEAWSIEDEGKLHFNIYIFNVQDGVEFSYYDGSSHAANSAANQSEDVSPEMGETIYYLNTNSGKFHTSDCQYADKEGFETTNLSRNQLIYDGYEPCKVCNP